MASDVSNLRQLLRECWLDTYSCLLPQSVIQTAINTWQSEENLLRGLTNQRAFYAGWLDNAKLVGMVSGGKIDENTLKIYQLYVHPSYQRRGIGFKLMGATIEHFGPKKVVLDVEEGNEKGLAFYRKFGFTYPRTTIISADGQEIPCLAAELNL